MTEPDPTVRDDHDMSRFTLHLDSTDDSRVVGHADYSIDGDVVVVLHVETDPDHRGNGYAARLMAGVLESARSNEQKIRPVCSYAVDYIRRHPATHDLVVA